MSEHSADNNALGTKRDYVLDGSSEAVSLVREARGLPQLSAENDAPNAATCDDLVWWNYSGMCGGCGSDDCHDGPCGNVETGWYDCRVCDRCPHRAAQGLVRVTPPAKGDQS